MECQFEGYLHPHGQGHRFSAGPKSVLLFPTKKDGQQRLVTADNERTDAERATALVGGHRHRVNAEESERDGYLANRLDSVRVNWDTVEMANCCNLSNWLDYTCLVICQRYTNQGHIGANPGSQRIEVDQAISGDIECVEPPPEVEEVFGSPQDARMLDCGDDNPSRGAACSRHSHPKDGEVIGLGPATGKDDPISVVRCIGIKKGKNFFPGTGQPCPGGPSGGVLTCRVPVVCKPGLADGLGNFGTNRACGVVIQVYRHGRVFFLYRLCGLFQG